MTEAPPGPKLSRVAAISYRFSRDPLSFLSDLAQTYGDLASFRMGDEQIYFVNDPHVIKDILVTHNRNFTKSRGLERTKRLSRQWPADQRRIAPSSTAAADAAGLSSRAHRVLRSDDGGGYADRAARALVATARHVDVSQEMMRLTLSIAGKTLFDVDVESQAADIGRGVTPSHGIVLVDDDAVRRPAGTTAGRPAAAGARPRATARRHHLRHDRRATR